MQTRISTGRRSSTTQKWRSPFSPSSTTKRRPRPWMEPQALEAWPITRQGEEAWPSLARRPRPFCARFPPTWPITWTWHGRPTRIQSTTTATPTFPGPRRRPRTVSRAVHRSKFPCSFPTLPRLPLPPVLARQSQPRYQSPYQSPTLLPSQR